MREPRVRTACVTNWQKSGKVSEPCGRPTLPYSIVCTRAFLNPSAGPTKVFGLQ